MWYRKNAKLLVALVLAVALVAALACGADEPEEPAAPAAPAAAAPAAPAAEAAPTAAPAAPAAPSAPAPAAPAAEAAPATAPAAPAAPSAPADVAAPAERTAGEMMAGAYVGPYQRGVDPFDMPSVFPYDGPRPTSWSESPQLAELVKAGTLEPLDDRVPVEDDRMVTAPLFGVGIYGGWYRTFSAVTLVMVGVPAYINKANTDGNRVSWIPKSIEVSDDGRQHIITMREGHRWSNGHDLDMEDVRFAFEDLNFNEEFTPVVRQTFHDGVTGNIAKWAAVDDVTWTLTFDSPSYLLFVGNPFGDGPDCIGWAYACDTEYSKQFHVKYADPNALKAAMAAGNYETWVQLFKKNHDTRAILNSPWLGAALVCLSEERAREVCRNPYFHNFDVDGQQLPYWDRAVLKRAESNEVKLFRGMLGEEDFGGLGGTADIPLMKGNMAKGDYSLYMWVNVGGSAYSPQFNQTFNDDTEIGRWMRTQDFRRALSLATDREGIKETVYLGIGDIRSNAPHVSSPFYPGAKYETLDSPAVPDFDAANALLDALGLVDTDGDGLRNRLDGGGNLKLFWEEPASILNRLEVINAGWTEIGITIDMKENPREYELLRANKTYMGGSRGGENFNNVGSLSGSPQVPCYAPWYGNVCPQISRWNTSDGEIGMGPTGPDNAFLPLAPAGTYPADVSGNLRGLEPMFQEARSLKALDPRQVQVAKDMNVILQDMKWMFGTVSHIGRIYMKRNNMLNPPVQAAGQRGNQGDWAELYFFEDGVDNVSNPGNRSKAYKSTSFR